MPKRKVNIIQLASDEAIIKKIYVVRDQKIMLDFDLAALYETETKYLKRTVRQHINRFPEDFMFELTKKELEVLRCNFSTSNQRGGTRYMPFAFTEQGVAMLSGVINSDKAIEMNIAIMRAFVDIRKFALSHKSIAEQIKILKNKLGEHDVQLNQIYEAIENLLDNKVDKELKQEIWNKRKRIGFKPE
ncbi:MAG TPA: ORF6N domain-containing protein [Ginsengibacter sp.]